jgi:apolipoprotein D and lipocalin family protein
MLRSRSWLRLSRAFACLAFAAGIAMLSACSKPVTRGNQPPIDLPRFMGTWYVVAHVPYFTDRGHVAARDEYTLQPDGKITVRYLYRTGFQQPSKILEATATVEPGSGGRDWRVRFFHVVPARQRILEIAPDGSWALLDSPGRDLAWVFARKPVMDDATYQDLLKRLRGYGVDSDKLWRVPQTPEQVGGLGFDRPKYE